MSKTKHLSILCVNHDPLVLRSMEQALAGAGLRVRTTDSGQNVLDEIEQFPPDLILLDVRTPGMDGCEVCSTLHNDERSAHVPVVLVAASDDEEEMARAFRAGAADYLVEPIDADALVAKVLENLAPAARRKASTSKEEGRGRLQPSEFDRFRKLLAERMGDDEAMRNRCANLAPTEIYVLAREAGMASSLMARLIAEFLGLPWVREIDSNEVDAGQLPIQFCQSNQVVVVGSAGANPQFIVANPFRWEVLDVLRSLVEPGAELELRIAAPIAFEGLFNNAVGAIEVVYEDDPDTPLHTPEAKPAAAHAAHGPVDSFDLLASSAAPAIRLSNKIIMEAVTARASDIHLEPQETELGLRFRVDGMLMPRPSIPKELQASLISRIKIMARLNIAERRVPQDGRIRVVFNGRPIDLRVSTLPARHGEKIVMRVLDKSAVSLDLDALGLEEGPLTGLRQSMAKPHGILLVTGPTGSGKTTTLYAVLTALNQPHANIVTVEDPIEYELARVNQVQVHPPAGLTFPVALRAILRQDPDIIMLGEIRDAETLDISMKAALTGHLVLSTLHTNDAVSTISRLVDMGSEPFMVASTVEMISAQRLLRKLCEKCKQPAQIPDETLAGFGVPIGKDARFFKPGGCAECNEVGYLGRLVVAELVVFDETLRMLVARSADSATLREHVFETMGASTLRQNAFRKAVAGLTSLEEVLRITV